MSAPLNADALAEIEDAMRHLDKLTSVGVVGEVMVMVSGLHVGYFFLHDENETEFSQKPNKT